MELFLAENAGGGWRLPSLEPYRTCVALEAVEEVLAAKVFRFVKGRGVE